MMNNYHSVLIMCPRSYKKSKQLQFVVLQVAVPSHDFLQSPLSLELLHHGASALTCTVWKQRWFWNSQTRIAAQLGLSLCTVTNAHRHCFGLFLSYEEYLFIFCQNQTCCLSHVCCTCVTLEGAETDELKMPAQAGATESAST